jgi:hypothetical protein
MNLKIVTVSCALLAAVGCASGVMEETSTNVRPMDGASSGLAHGDCVEANRMALARPDLDVDSVPRVVAQKPAPFTRMPDSVRAVISRKGSSVKVDVVVDTLGRPVMKTFTVVEATHPWLAASVKSAMPSWRFRAARLAGCKVPRVYKFSATSRPRA